MDKTPGGLDLNDPSYEVSFESKATNYTLAVMVDEEGKVFTYNDPKWDDHLDQLTLLSQVKLVLR